MKKKYNNKLQVMPLTFYLFIKLKVQRMEDLSLTEICRLLASLYVVVNSSPYGNVQELAVNREDRIREVHDLFNERAPSRPICWKDRYLDNLQDKRSGAETKMYV